MTLSQIVWLFLYPAAVGLGLGFIFYGGLWLVLRRLQKFKHPGAWVGLSLVARTLLVVAVLYLLFGHTWQQLLIAVVGMLVARNLLVQRIRPGRGDIDKSGRTVQ